eukprot:TRINITY_DN11454_c0_g1_i2.p1 TRINITY_DN11454_c0_g1~~TRINITY_DN11454_c0_g1_i2.p1  ORF type:complete len:1822 (-),score=302.23 TRINITY_DN11454_c0_g1_i2:14-5479(-)
MALALESLSHAADKMQQLVDMLNSLNMHSLDQTPRDEFATSTWPEISVLGADTWTKKTFNNEAPGTTDKMPTAATWTTASTAYGTMTGFSINDSMDQSFVESFAEDLDRAELFRRRIRGRLVASIREGRLPLMLQESSPLSAPVMQSDDRPLNEIEQSRMQPALQVVASPLSTGMDYVRVSFPREEPYADQAKHVPEEPAAQIKPSGEYLPMSQSGRARRKVSCCSESSQNSATAGIGEALGCAANSMQQLLNALKEALADSPEPSPRIMPPIALDRNETQPPAGYAELQAHKQQQQWRQPSGRMQSAVQAERQQSQSQTEQQLNIAKLHNQECKVGASSAEGSFGETQAEYHASDTEVTLQSRQQAVAPDSNASQACDTDVPHRQPRSKLTHSVNGDVAPVSLGAGLVASVKGNYVPSGSIPEETAQTNQHTAATSVTFPKACDRDVLRRRLRSKFIQSIDANWYSKNSRMFIDQNQNSLEPDPSVPLGALKQLHGAKTPESNSPKDPAGVSLRRRLRSKLIVTIKENCPINMLWSDESPKQSPRQHARSELSKTRLGETDALRRLHTIQENCVPDILLPLGASKGYSQQQAPPESRASEECSDDTVHRPVRSTFRDTTDTAHASKLSGISASTQHSSSKHPEMQTFKECDTTSFRRRLRSKLIDSIGKNDTTELFVSDGSLRSETQHHGPVDQALLQMPSERLSKVVTDVRSVGEDLQQLLGSVRSAAASREQTPRTEAPATGPMTVDCKQDARHPELEEPWLMPLLQHRMDADASPSRKFPETMLHGFELASKYLDDLLQLLAKVEAEHLDGTPRSPVKPTSDADGSYTGPEEVPFALASFAPASAVVTLHQNLSAEDVTPPSEAGHSCRAEVHPSQEATIPVFVDASQEWSFAAEAAHGQPEKIAVTSKKGLRAGQETLRRRLRCGFLQGLRAGSAEVALERAFTSEEPADPAENNLEVHTLPTESCVSPEKVSAESMEEQKPVQASLKQRLRHGFLQRLHDGSAESAMGRAFACEAHAAPTGTCPEVLAPKTEPPVSPAEVPAASAGTSRLGLHSLRQRLCHGLLEQLQNGTVEDALERAFASAATAGPAETSPEMIVPQTESFVSQEEVLAMSAEASWPGHDSLRHCLHQGFLQQLQDGSVEVAIGRAIVNDPGDSFPEVLAAPTETLIPLLEVPSPMMEASRLDNEALRHRLRDGFLQQLRDGSAEAAIGRASAREAPATLAEPSLEVFAAPAESLASPTKVPAGSAEASGSCEETLRHRLRHGFLQQVQDGRVETTMGRAFATEASNWSAKPSPAVIATPTDVFVSPAEMRTASTEGLGLRPIGQPIHALKQRLRAGLKSAIQGDFLADILQKDSWQEAGSSEAITLKVAGPPKKDASCEAARLKLRSGLLGAVRTGSATELMQATSDSSHPSIPVPAVAATEADGNHKQFLQKTERFLRKLEAFPSTTPAAPTVPVSQKRPQQSPFAAAVSFVAARAARRFKNQAELGEKTSQEGVGSYKSQSVQPEASASSLLCRRALLTLAEAIWDGRLEAPLEGFGCIMSNEIHKVENAGMPSSCSSLDDDAWLDEIVEKKLLSSGKLEDDCESEASTAVGTPRLSCMIPDLPSARSSEAAQEADLTSMIPGLNSSMTSSSMQPADEERALQSSWLLNTSEEENLTSMIPDVPSSIASSSTQAAKAGKEPTPYLCRLMPAAGVRHAAAQEWEPSPCLSKPSLGARTIVWDGTKWIRTKSEPQLAPLPRAPLLPMQSAQLDASPWGTISKTPLATPGTLPSMPAGGAHHAARWLAGTCDINAEIGTPRALGSQWMQRKWL